MAIKKQITLSSGIKTEYHRIALLSIDVNQKNTILVHSYLNEDGRQIEKDYAAGKYNNLDAGMMNFPYVNTQYIVADYNPTMTISAAYDYIKTLPEFDGAEDI